MIGESQIRWDGMHNSTYCDPHCWNFPTLDMWTFKDAFSIVQYDFSPRHFKKEFDIIYSNSKPPIAIQLYLFLCLVSLLKAVLKFVTNCIIFEPISAERFLYWIVCDEEWHGSLNKEACPCRSIFLFLSCRKIKLKKMLKVWQRKKMLWDKCNERRSRINYGMKLYVVHDLM